MARAKTQQRAGVPDLRPHDLDVNATGSEPLFVLQPDPDRRKLAIIVGLNWYSRYYDRKMAQEQLAVFCDYINKPELATLVRHAGPANVQPSIAWMARMCVRGLQLTESEAGVITTHIAAVAATIHRPEVVERPRNTVNIQEIMRERAQEAAGELEGALDDFIEAGPRAGDAQVDVIGPLTARKILPQHASILGEAWQNRRDEYEAALAGTDPQLAEGYSHLSKTELKAMIKFCEAVIQGLQGYVNVAKANKSVRKRKPVSPERQASKVRYLKEFPAMKLTSISPAKLIGASEIWLYDTAKRKLVYYVADEHVGTMTVKGTTVVGFDTARSGIKTLRKPEEVIKRFMAAGKPASRKMFQEIRAVQAVPNGRTNENIIILKAY